MCGDDWGGSGCHDFLDRWPRAQHHCHRQGQGQAGSGAVAQNENQTMSDGRVCEAGSSCSRENFLKKILGFMIRRYTRRDMIGHITVGHRFPSEQRS